MSPKQGARLALNIVMCCGAVGAILCSLGDITRFHPSAQIT